MHESSSQDENDGGDRPGSLSLSDDTSGFDDTVTEKGSSLQSAQADNPCDSSQVFPLTLSKDYKILLQPDLSAEQKLEIILNFSKYIPVGIYKFPTKVEYGKNRAFQHWYLQSFAWLGYSIAEDGCFCLPCCLFGSSDNLLQNFVQKPFCNWTNFNDKVKAHSTSSFHLKSVMAMESFKEAQSGLQPTIDTSFEKHRKDLYDLNYKRLDAIIDCVVLCRKQNIPFCGHQDCNASKSLNKGNFKAVLEFRALGDSILQNHLTDGAKNAQYTSAETQNEIVSLCKFLILEKIGNEIKENGLFSIICDECTYSANKEQLSLSLRYVANEKICECFVGFFELNEGVTGEAIAGTIAT